MPPTRNVAHGLQADKTFLAIEINPPLPCGYNCCGRLARRCLVERDQQVRALWSLLPICEEHAALFAAEVSSLVTAAPHRSGGKP
jgi:hypothetical protein